LATKSVSPYSAHQYGETQEKIMGRKIKKVRLQFAIGEENYYENT